MRNGTPAVDKRSLGRPPKSREPTPLPKSVGAIKDWRYYRRTGATWTDLYNTPERRIKLTGLVTKESLKADIAGLEHICAVVAEEQRAALEEEERKCQRALELRMEFLGQTKINRKKPGGADYLPRPCKKDNPIEPKPKSEEFIASSMTQRAYHHIVNLNLTQALGISTPSQRAQRPQSPSLTASMREKHGALTRQLNKNIHGMDQRRRLFNRLGCQDMKGLLVTDRGLAVHINALARELEVRVPTYPFIPNPPHLEHKVRT